jgi:prepilin-type N-terminal cleavage/methylation domain-containing protein
MRRVNQCVTKQAGFSLIEVVISTLLVGLILVASMKSFGAVLRHRQFSTDRDRAILLAEDLVAEILENGYSDPDEPLAFGRELGESGGSRTDYDDVDDFHNWDATPPQQRDGTVMTGLSTWRRTVTVENVNRNNLMTPVGNDAGVKQITVNVYHNDQLLATQIAIRTNAWKPEL